MGLDLKNLPAIPDDGKLDTGMTVQEAIKRASDWWDRKGRLLVASELRGTLATLDTAEENFNPSRILSGLEWDLLEKREKLQIVKWWHHFAIRRPDALGIEPDKRFILGEEEKQT